MVVTSMRNELPSRMPAWRIHSLGSIVPGREPLMLDDVPVPYPGPGELLLKVVACGVCHTELDEIEGRTAPPRLPVTPGHQVVGSVVSVGLGCTRQLAGRLVGVGWIHSSCGQCRWCRCGLENLCPNFKACGRDQDGGYAPFMTVPEQFAAPLPAGLHPAQAAPLLCAGAVGLRSIRLCDISDGQPVGLTGFGASGHLVLQMLKFLYPASAVSVFARSSTERDLARRLGADWAGDTLDSPPGLLAAIIDTTPAWKPVVAALGVLEPAGKLVINAIAKEADDQEQLLELDYPRHLWLEKIVRSVTNVTRADIRDCLQMAVDIPLRPKIRTFAFPQANTALHSLREDGRGGACVLMMDPT